VSIIPNHHLVNQIQTRYHVGPHFARAYLDYWQRGFTWPFNDLDEILRLPPPQSTWFEYAITTNTRGQWLVEQCARYLPQDARRFLDIGCGYGGVLVAFSKLELEVTGIDIDDDLLPLARANCLDHNLGDCTHQISILEENLPKQLGRFDVITLISVIEHVADVQATLAHIVELLAPGGIAILIIPNYQSLSVVAQDPHYNLFAISLLEPPQALAYYQALFQGEYGVGEYHPLADYLTQLKRLGCQTHVDCTWQTAFKLQARVVYDSLILSNRRRNFSRKIHLQIPASLAEQIALRYQAYRNLLWRDLTRRPLSPFRPDSWQQTYLAVTWTVIATKK
jgi:2-polyprenyl-3-methyl-5-hydroxy-6-metoxy-1,4-benzoquinol methylase